MKLFDSFPKPLQADIRTGAWIPIVGAGMSRNAVLPDGLQMPTWKDLGALLAADVSDYAWDGDAIDAISAYGHEHGRFRLLSVIADLLHTGKAEPGRAHEAFCRLDMKTVVTTNFDFLLDEQYRRLGKPCLPIVEEQQLALSNPHAGPTLIKLHGDLHHPNEVTATEEDYDKVLRSKPLMATALASLLISRTGVLVGYSLGDPDVRQILALLSERLGSNRRPIYALLIEPSSVDVTRFLRRGITPVSLPLVLDHGETLARLFDEIRQAMDEEVSRTALGSTVESTVGLRLPRSVSRLVYFSVSPRDAALYRSHVFPELSALGAVPVTADDISTEPGTERSKASAVLQRAIAAVVDLSTEYGPYELGLARSANVPTVIGVLPRDREFKQLPSDLLEYHILRAPSDDDEDSWRTFSQLISERLASLSNRSDVTLLDETEMLIREKRWLPALLTSTSMLEAVLASRVDPDFGVERRRPLSLREVLRLAERQQLLKPREVQQLMALMTLRNKAAHGSATEVNATETEPLLKAAVRIAHRLTNMR